MDSVDIELIVNDIKNEIDKKKNDDNYLINFIAKELSKGDLTNEDQVISIILDNVEMKYKTKEETRDILKKKIQDYKSQNIDQYKYKTYSELQTLSGEMDPSVFHAMRDLLNKLEKNKDLTNLQDGALHFGKSHFNIAKKIFFLQITQNYLSALKYLMINDLVTKQTSFNVATEDSLANIVSLISELKRQNEISTTEFKNYMRDSEKWIQNNEYRILNLEENITKLSDSTSQLTENKKLIEDLKYQTEISSTENKKLIEDLKYQTEISSTENKKLIEDLKYQTEISSTEFKNYIRDSEKWIQKDEAILNDLISKASHVETDNIKTELKNFETRISDLLFKLEEIQNITESNKIPGYLILKMLEQESNKIEPLPKKESKNKSNDTLYFLHIPKTAGTSFLDILDYFYDVSDICKSHDWQQLLPNFPKVFKPKLIHGHFGYGIRKLLPKKPSYITMLRNPIDRTISDYYQSIRTKNMGAETEFFRNTTLTDIINDESKKWRFTNNQAKHIAFDIDPTSLINSKENENVDRFSRFLTRDFTSPQTSDEELLLLAKKHLEEFAFVGITERFEESLLLLYYTFEWKPIRVIPRLNVTPDKQSQEGISKQTLQEIEKCNKIDIQLYNFALKLFEDRFSNMVKDLMKNYYSPVLSSLSFRELMYELLERHYQKNYWKNASDISTLDYDFGSTMIGTNWYSREIKNGKFFRWSGPSTSSTIDIQKMKKTNSKIQFHICDYIIPETAENVKLKINEFDIDLKITNNNKLERELTLEGIIHSKFLESPNNFTRLTFSIDKTYDLQTLKPALNDYRRVGIAMDQIKITPA